jgi:hypothetical protein
MEYRSGAIPRGLLQLRVERLRDRIARAKQCPLLARKPTLVQRWHSQQRANKRSLAGQPISASRPLFDVAYMRKTASPSKSANEPTVNESQKRSGAINRSPQAESAHSFLKLRYLGLIADSLATSEPFLTSALTAG